MVYFKPNRVGIQEKYFQAITKTGEVDVKVRAIVEPVPRLQHIITEIKIARAGVYKLPLRC